MNTILLKVVVVLMMENQFLEGLDNSKSVTIEFENYSNADNCTCQPTNLNRYSRQGQDPLDIAIDRMQIIGRFTNAIYLQQGLLDKSVLPYDVIAELLFFGNVKQEALNDPGIGKVFEEIKTLPETLKTSDRSTLEAETTYQTLFNMRKLIDGVKDLDKWKQKDTLLTDLNDFKTKGYDKTILNEIGNLMSGLKANFDDVKKVANTKDESESKVHFKNIFNRIESLVTKTADLSNKLPNMAKMLNGQNATSSFSDIHKLSTAVRQFAEAKSQMGNNPNGRTNLNQKMDLVSGLAKKTVGILPFLESIKMIMESRKVADRRRGLRLTNGFPNGFSDLATLPVLVLNPWLKKLSGIHTLPKVFPPLEAFIATFKEVSDDLIPLRDPNSQSINNLHSFLKDVIASGSFPSDAKTVTDTVYQCYEEALAAKTFTPLDLTSSQETLGEIDIQMAQMAQILDFFKSDKVSTMLKEVKEIASQGNTDDVAVLKKSVEELSALDTKIGFDDVFNKFKELSSNAVNVANAQIDPKSVIDKFGEIDTFISGDLVSFQNIFTNLQKVNLEDAEKASRIMEKSKKLQNPIPDPVKQEMTQVTKLTGTLQKLKSVGDVIATMKTKQNDDSKALAALDTPSKHSETLGSATRGIVDFRDVIAQKPDFATIQTHLQLVDDKMKPDLSKFQALSDALDAWKTTVTLPDSQKLEDFSKIFLDAKSISGIDDVKKISDGVEKLQKSTKDPAKQKSLGELKKALDVLDSLGLDFVRYQQSFGNSEDSLKALDLFFAKWRGLLNPSSVAPLSVTNALNSESSTPAGVVPDVTGEATMAAAVLFGLGWLELIGIVLAIIFVVVATVLTCKYRKKLPCSKEKKKKKPIVDNDDGKKASTSGSTSTVASDSGENLGDKKAKLSKMEKGTAGMKKEGKDEKKDPDGGKEAALNVQVKDETKVEKKKEEKKEEKKDKKENPVPPPPPPPAKVELKEPPPVVSTPNPPPEQVPADAPNMLVFTPNCYQRVLLDVTKHLLDTQENVKGNALLELNDPALYDFAEDISNRAELDAADWRKKARANDQNRVVYQANPRTSIIIHKDVFNRCFYKDNYFNGNCHFMPNGQMFFITQGPMIGAKGRTDDKFYYFISQTKCGVIIFFKSKTEAEEKAFCSYFPTVPNEFESLSADNQTPFTATCLNKEVVIEGILIKRELLIEYTAPPAPPAASASAVPAAPPTPAGPPAPAAPSAKLAPPPQPAQPAPPAKTEQPRKTAGQEEFFDDQIESDFEENDWYDAFLDDEQPEQPGPSSRTRAGGDDDGLDSEGRVLKKYKPDGERDYAHESFDPDKIYHKVIHYEYIGWEEDVPPKNLNAIQYLLNLIQDQPSVCVHSKEGFNRAGAFTCLEVARQNLCIKLSRNPNDANISFEGVLREVRATRKNAVTTVAHFGLVVKAIVDMAKAENTDKAVEEKMASMYAKFSNSYVYCCEMTLMKLDPKEGARKEKFEAMKKAWYEKQEKQKLKANKNQKKK